MRVAGRSIDVSLLVIRQGIGGDLPSRIGRWLRGHPLFGQAEVCASARSCLRLADASDLSDLNLLNGQVIVFTFSCDRAPPLRCDYYLQRD